MKRQLFKFIDSLLDSPHFIRLFTLLLVILGSIDFVFAIHQPHVINFTREQYNAYSKNWSVSHSDQGMIYVGNDVGLLQFDGINWKLYALPNGRKVRSVFVGNDQKIYTGSYEEFGYWEKDKVGQLHYTSLSDSLVGFELHNEEIWKITQDDEGKVYFQSFSVVFTLDKGKIHHNRLENSILFLLEARDKTIAQVTRHNLVEFKDDQFTEIPHSGFMNQSFTRVFLPYQKEDFLLGSIEKGLTIWSDGKFKEWHCPAQDSLKGKEINRGIFDGENYYIGTIQDGIYVINESGEVLIHLNTQNYLESNTVLGMDLDHQGRLWVAMNKGISCIDFNYPLHFVTERKQNIGVVNTSAFYDGNLYLGTNQGVYRCTNVGNDISKLKLNDFALLPGSGGHVWSLQVVDGQLLCGHNTGSFRIEKDKMIRISRIGGGYNFKKFVVKGQELLIQSTYTSLILFRKDEKGLWSFFRRLRGFQEPSRFIAVDPFGNIWVNHFHKKEIYKMRLGENFRAPLEVQKYGKNKGLPADLGFHVFEFYKRIVFTSTEGIFTYDDFKDTIVPYNRLNDVLGEFSRADRILKGNGDGYWFVTSQKIACFKKKNDTFVKKMECLLNDYNRRLVEGSENIIPVRKEETLICLENGYAVLKGDSIIRNNSDSSIFFSMVKSGSQTTEEKLMCLDEREGEPKIPYLGNFIAFHYSSLVSPGKPILFQTYLQGLDKEWSVLSSQTSKEYFRLPWGKYVLKVKGQDEFGHHLAEISYPFEILPPWYATKLAIVLFLLISLLFVVVTPLGIRMYYRKQRATYQREQDRLLMEKQEEERLRAERNLIKYRNQSLRNELSHKSSELANSTMSIIRKNNVLLDVKTEILKQKEVLKQRYPDKYLEKVIKLIDENIDNQDDWEIFEKHFDRAHVDFFNRLKDDYPKLTPNDLRLCAYLKMNLTTKEIAPLMNISPRSVEVHRYRLRKKLDFSSSDNLNEFMIQF